jgi:hypothetical protein
LPESGDNLRGALFPRPGVNNNKKKDRSQAMSWYQEVGQTLSIAIARLDASQRRTERENCSSTVVDDLRLFGVLPASQQANQSHQSADGVEV